MDEAKEKNRIQKKTDLQREAKWLWMCSVPGWYRCHQEKMISYFGGLDEAVEQKPEEWNRLAQKPGMSWMKKAAEYKNRYLPEDCMHRIREMNIKFISNEHPSYPQELKSFHDFPYGFFYKGKFPDAKMQKAAVVGARKCSWYGKDMAELIARSLAGHKIAVISGGAFGIDGIAQREALRQEGESYAVFGCGVDRCYPAGNAGLFEQLEKQGGILSEFPPGTPPLRHHFPLRNRIISALSQVVIVVEAEKKSGSLITAEFAAEQGKEVYVVPGRYGDLTSEGCNELISQGAAVFLSPEQLLEEVFGICKNAKSIKLEQLPLAPAEKLVYSSLDLHSKSLETLQQCTGISFARLSEILIQLEKMGMAEEVSANYFVKL